MTRAGTRSAAVRGRRRYRLKNTRVAWTEEEKTLFKEGLEQHGRNWRLVTAVVKTKTIVQVRSHAQKHFLREEAKAQAAKKAERAAEEAKALAAKADKRGPSEASNNEASASAVSAIETNAQPNLPNPMNPIFLGDPRVVVYGSPSPPMTPTNFFAHHAGNHGTIAGPLRHHPHGVPYYYNAPRHVAMHHPHPIAIPVAAMRGIAPAYPQPLPVGAARVAMAVAGASMAVPRLAPPMQMTVTMPVTGAGPLMPLASTNGRWNGGAHKTKVVMPERSDENVSEDMLGAVDLLLDASEAMDGGQRAQATVRSAMPISVLLN